MEVVDRAGCRAITRWQPEFFRCLCRADGLGRVIMVCPRAALDVHRCTDWVSMKSTLVRPLIAAVLAAVLALSSGMAAAESPAVGEAPATGALGPDVAVELGGFEDLSLEDLLNVQVRSASFFALPAEKVPNTSYRSEERRVGKECRSRWS